MSYFRDNYPLGMFFGNEPDEEGLLYRESQRLDWVEHSFSFDSKIGKQVAVPMSGEFLGNSFAKGRVFLFFIMLIVFFGLLMGRMIYLQLYKGNHYAALSEGNRERLIPIPAERGLLLDRNGIALTKNVPNFSLALVPQDLPKRGKGREELIATLARLTDQPEDQLQETINKFGSYSYESIVILEDLDYETALELHVASGNLPGIQIARGSKRLYEVEGAEASLYSLSHVLGYLGKLDEEELDRLYTSGYLPSDNLGKVGLEKTYETLLRGTYGKRRAEVDVLGREQATLSEIPPTPGKHLSLSIDAQMQEALTRIMQENMDKAGKTKAAGIAMDPRNGEILALVNLPAYDNNDFSGGIDVASYKKYIENKDAPLFNRAIGGVYPSGSTIKPAVALAALQEGIITPNTAFLSNGGIAVGQWFFPDWLAGGHGMTNVRKSLADSVNTFYYYIGGGYKEFSGLGVENITNYLRKFGFSQRLGIDLPGEELGFLPSKQWKRETKGERWYIGDTYNLSIGQGDLLVTPLQIASLTATIANGGTMYKPHLVRAVVDPVTKQEDVVKPEVIRKDIVQSEHIQTIRKGMNDCVTYGSCLRLSLLPFSSAGKTGTAQWSSTKEPHAWFTSFAPFESPELVVTILVEEGEGGSKMGAPIAHQFYKWWGENKK